MTRKFAFLRYSEKREDFIFDGLIRKLNNKKLDKIYIKKHFPLSVTEHSIMDTPGYIVRLPLTQEMANEDKDFKNLVVENALISLKENAVVALHADKNLEYTHDNEIISNSGFYVLPFMLKAILQKCAKKQGKEIGRLKVLLIDGNKDLVLDILCIISREINDISIFTEDMELYSGVAENLCYDSGVNVQITNSAVNFSVAEADVILDTSLGIDKLRTSFRKEAVYIDMLGNAKRTDIFAAQRDDMLVFNGCEIRSNNEYFDNAVLEMLCQTNVPSFAKYISETFGDSDFYEILDYVEKLDIKITVFMRNGKKIS